MAYVFDRAYTQGSAFTSPVTQSWHKIHPLTCYMQVFKI